jgi:autotransporter-associated beta strand protein
VATSTDLANSTLGLTTGGVARSANFVVAESTLATGQLVYRFSGNDFTQGVQLGQISLNGAVIRDAAGNALTPAGLNPLLASIDVTEGQTLSFNGGYTGAGDFIKTGLGELILTGNSTHTGNTVVRGGTLTITSGSFTSTGTLLVGGGAGATGTLDILGGTVTTNSTAIGSGSSSGVATVSGGTWTNTADLSIANGTLAITGGIVVVGGTLSESTANSIDLQAGGGDARDVLVVQILDDARCTICGLVLGCT